MKEALKCCLCGKKVVGYGNNPWPLVKDIKSRCCDQCNTTKVVPARISEHFKQVATKARR